ncbi:MAG: hypothetical protein WA484_11010 [Solirubrobacteraceae bacterium]
MAGGEFRLGFSRVGLSCVVGVALVCCVILTVGLVGFLPAVASADSCPNAVFRNGPSSRLPDCRAYEMVTPPYKEGYPVYVTLGVASPTLSSDGSRVEGESIGAFAGTEDSKFSGYGAYFVGGGLYTFTRGLEGWGTMAISPPPSQYEQAYSPFSSASLSESLWVASTPAQKEAVVNEKAGRAVDFYVRSLNGPLSVVGPVAPPSVDLAAFPREYYVFRGASSNDLSDVFFSMSGVRWPGDRTVPGGESVYEYVGTGNLEPLLVGVSGGQGSESLISKCGTSLDRGLGIGREAGRYPPISGGAKDVTTALGAISDDGDTVLFTPTPCGSFPVVQEIYARIDNGLPDAHTVAISEPSEEDCVVCDTVKTARQNAVPVSMSRDGSRVLFMTSQPLLGGDSSNNLYEYDFAGEPEARIVRVSAGDSSVSNPVAGVENAVNVSPDGSHVYFYASGVLTKTRGVLGQEAQAGQSNLYLYERDAQYPDGRTVFIAPHTDVHAVSYVSQNGRFVLFESSVHLTPDDLSSVPQEFEYDSETGSIVRVSIGQDGYNDNGNTGSVTKALVANDGAVFFESKNPLVPEAVNGAPDVYEYRDGSVSLISDGQDTHSQPGVLDYISPSGMDVFFSTYDQLVPRDIDAQEDTYDARVDGGFPEASVAPPCEGDACQGPLSGSPVLLSPGSEFQAGGENATAAPSPPPVVVAAKSKHHKPAKKSKTAKAKRKAKKSSRRKHGPHRTGGRA